MLFVKAPKSRVWLYCLRHRVRGMALGVVLLLITVVVVGLAALLATAGRGLFASSQYQGRAIAKQAAEAGLARAQATLEADISFGGRLEEELTEGQGRFVVDFTGAATSKVRSYNNLASSVALGIPAGDLPAHSAFIVAIGSYDGFEVVLKAQVKAADESLKFAGLASGVLEFDGSSTVSGLTSFTSGVSIEAGLHSNTTEPGSAIVWNGSAGDVLSVTGMVTSSAPAGSIQLSPLGTVSVKGTLTDQPPVPQLDYDIRELVERHSSSPGTPFPPAGLVTLGPGVHYFAGDQVIQGDLRLENGAELYVKGNLTVNGSIEGSGTVAVTKFTTLKGSSYLSATEGQYVALMSREGVSLTGFDGTSFLNTFTSSTPSLASDWNEVQGAIKGLQDMTDPTKPPGDWAGEKPYSNGDFDLTRQPLSTKNGAAARLEHAMPSGATGTFLAQKFYDIRLFYHKAWFDMDDVMVFDYVTPGHDRRAYAKELLGDYLTGALDPKKGGLADVLTSQDANFESLDSELQSGILRVRARIQMEDLNRLGSAWFKGFVYSNGPIYVANEVTAIGAMETQGLEGVPDRTFGHRTLKAGDMYFAKGSELIYVDELLRSPAALGRSGLLKVVFQFEE